MRKVGQELPKVFLQTGDCFFGVAPTLITTVLGSCVAVTMHVPKMGIGAICHAFLPDSSAGKRGGNEPQICRFVDTALQNMLESMDKVGVPRRDLVLKLFGGSSGIAVRGMEYSSYDIGRRNVEMARKLLRFARLELTAQDVGGNQGRKLLFNTRSGEVWIKRLRQVAFEKQDGDGTRGTKF
ncbi:MAG: chemotaxis protein CheD [Pseudomonadota bacterium]